MKLYPIYNFKKRISMVYNQKNNYLIIKNFLGNYSYNLKSFFFLIKDSKIKGFVSLNLISHFLFLFENFLLLYKYNMYFNHLKIYGLGFRISIISQTRIRLDFG
jgi:hypothetical protein